MNNIEEKINIKKDFIKTQKLDETVKANMKNAMKKEYESKSTNNKIYKKIAVIILVIFATASITLAGNIENMLSLIFSNTQMDKKQEIDLDCVQNINSEYIIDAGIALNIAYIYEDIDYFYIVMNAKSDEDIQELLFINYKIEDITNDRIYSNYSDVENDLSVLSMQYKSDYDMIFIKIRKDEKLANINNFELTINDLLIRNYNNEKNLIKGNWNFKINKSLEN